MKETNIRRAAATCWLDNPGQPVQFCSTDMTHLSSDPQTHNIFVLSILHCSRMQLQNTTAKRYHSKDESSDNMKSNRPAGGVAGFMVLGYMAWEGVPSVANSIKMVKNFLTPYSCVCCKRAYCSEHLASCWK